jgi:hypothetical protein
MPFCVCFTTNIYTNVVTVKRILTKAHNQRLQYVDYDLEAQNMQYTILKQL